MANMGDLHHRGIWTPDKEDKLVELWARRPCLYVISSADYADVTKKVLAIKEIADELGLSESRVRKRIKSLRTQYIRARRQGQAKQVTKKTIWLKERLQFIENTIGTRPSTWKPKIQESKVEQYREDLSVTVMTETPKSSKEVLGAEEERRQKTAKHGQYDEKLAHLKSIAKSVGSPSVPESRQTSDPCRAFGAYVGQVLQTLNEEERLLAIHSIQNIIFQAQMEKLQQT